jgi:signal transduction histidine kinase
MEQFPADVSHELRIPISVMRTQLERALDKSAGIEEIKTIVANCLDETLRMSSLIENLLLLASADAGEDIIQRDNIALHDLVRSIYDESIIIASQKSISVTLLNVDEIMVTGDEPRLRQMLLNLIDNAVKFNHANGKIDIRLTRENTAAKIIITDSGIGIPEEEQTRIFDRFYRIDPARSRELGGTGLGLSIVRWIVNAHGGTIRVVSSVNAGSSFYVSLPVKS